MSAASARMQMDMRGRGTWGSLQARIHVGCGIRLRKRGYALDGARETLVTLGVVVLETDLEFDRLDEVAALLALRFGQEVTDGAPHACH